jgi:hypothetical protein
MLSTSQAVLLSVLPTQAVICLPCFLGAVCLQGVLTGQVHPQGIPA